MSTAQATPVVTTPPTSTPPPAAPPEPSGVAWVARFPTSTSVADCVQPFRANVTAFIAALRAAGASVDIAATLRPAQRAWLMHWCWAIVHHVVDPRGVPARGDVAIVWAHTNAQGGYDAAASMAAAQAMVDAYGMHGLEVAPALNSEHTAGTAIDMAIAWTGTLAIADRAGKPVKIASLPRTGMNPDLKTVGASYGVIKFVGGASDIPHWSIDGH